MRKVYICSPYRATDSAELDRNIEYAQLLTRQALDAGLAPITPHLYLTQCTNEDKPEERAAALAAGLELLKCCDFVIVGTKYGVSEGMSGEIETAAEMRLSVIDAKCLACKLKYDERQREKQAIEYAKHFACNFCKGYSLHSCTGYDCRKPYQSAYEYAKRLYKDGQQP